MLYQIYIFPVCECVCWCVWASTYRHTHTHQVHISCVNVSVVLCCSCYTQMYTRQRCFVFINFECGMEPAFVFFLGRPEPTICSRTLCFCECVLWRNILSKINIPFFTSKHCSRKIQSLYVFFWWKTFCCTVYVHWSVVCFSPSCCDVFVVSSVLLRLKFCVSYSLCCPVVCEILRARRRLIN